MTDTTRQELLALAIRLEVEEAPVPFSEVEGGSVGLTPKENIENIPTKVLHQHLLDNHPDEVAH